MKTQYATAMSLDGFLADTENSLDWLFQFGDGPGEDHARFMEDVGAIAMGSTTYEWLLEHEIRPGSEQQKPWPYRQPTWVFTSRRLPAIPGADIRFVRGDVRPVHAEMTRAADGRNIWITGGGELVGQFLDQGLLDEIIVAVASVTLGGGAPLLPRRIVAPPLRLKLVEQFGADFVHLTYEVQRATPEG
ncbi:MAG: dihydrofolate reductase [Planctomyces sp.]|nr:dihydrofolate reductase [Planctomyces sp.]